MDNQNQVPAQQPLTVPAQPQQFATTQHQRPKSKVKTIMLTFLFVLLLGGAGFLAYEYKITNDALKKQSQNLATAYDTVGKFQAIINTNQAEKDFIAKNNTALLSRSSCSGKALLMSDVHISEKFAVYRYLCADTSTPIRIGALKKLNDGTYEFTYGDGTAQTNRLPSYIYDDDPTFFATYGVKRF